MIRQPLVSVISPCWNGERYISRMLKSIINQTYKNIEMICIDDGSTDETGDIIKSYIDRFEQAGMKLTYYYQENKGQAAALDMGLKHIQGDYLTWIDCDDFITEDSVEKRVRAFEAHPECSIVTSDLYIVDEKNVNHVLEIRGDNFGTLNYQKNQFFLTLTGHSIMECHCQMIRVSDMKKINPQMKISTCRAGQNFQILLPMLYYYKRFFVDEPLAYYVIRKDSHYHRERNRAEWIERYDLLVNMLYETFNGMNLSERETQRYVKMSSFWNQRRRLM